MAFPWFKQKRRQKLLAEPFPETWREYLRVNVRYYSLLDESKRSVVESFVRAFVAEKNWYGGEGLAVTDEMKVTVAGQAALLILGLKEVYFFDRMQSIILHPAAFKHTEPQSQSIFGNLKVLLGQAWYHSPILLSWRDVLRCGHNKSNGMNVVLHEFAHHLDGLDGDVDGSPPLRGKKLEDWYQIADAEYRRLVGSVRRGEATLLDHYGATSLIEFFAVATECFFERPRAMWGTHRELYAILQDFYNQDPASWLPDATTEDASSRAEVKAKNAEDDSAADPPEWDAAGVDELFTTVAIYINEGRYGLAERAASRALALDPADGEVYQNRAQARVKLGKFAEALNDCNTALEIDVEDVDAYRWRAAALIGLERYKEAEDDLKYVFAHTRDDAEASYLRGRIALAQGQYEQAVSDFSRSLWKRPLNAEVHYRRGLAYDQLGKLAEAEADRQKAFDLDPQVDKRP
jgi:MtfA peptidase